MAESAPYKSFVPDEPDPLIVRESEYQLSVEQRTRARIHESCLFAFSRHFFPCLTHVHACLGCATAVTGSVRKHDMRKPVYMRKRIPMAISMYM